MTWRESRGYTLHQKKKHPESLAAAEAAVKLKPDDPNILETAARAFIGWDKKDRAPAAVNKAMAISTTPSRYKGTEKKIKDAIEKKKQGK